MAQRFTWTIVIATASLLLISSCKKKTDLTPLPPLNPLPPVEMFWSFEATPEWEQEFNADGPPPAASWIAEPAGMAGGIMNISIIRPMEMPLLKMAF